MPGPRLVDAERTHAGNIAILVRGRRAVGLPPDAEVWHGVCSRQGGISRRMGPLR